jgi:hypothetical protein
MEGEEEGLVLLLSWPWSIWTKEGGQRMVCGQKEVGMSSDKRPIQQLRHLIPPLS